MIKIKNTKIFTVDKECKYHWSNLPKMIEIMRKEVLDLRGADLKNACLSYADLSHACLENADLKNACLSYACLKNACLEGACLENANLRYADLEGACLENSIIEDFFYVRGLGSQNRITYFFKTKEYNIIIRCGCFSGTLKEFKNKVKETHGDNQYAKEYLAMIEVAKIRFSRG